MCIRTKAKFSFLKMTACRNGPAKSTGNITLDLLHRSCWFFWVFFWQGVLRN